MNKEWLEIVSFIANKNKNKYSVMMGGSEEKLKNIKQLSSYKMIYDYCNNETLKRWND